MKNHFTKQNIFSFLTILALISNIAISGISNDSVISSVIKIISSALLFAIFFIHSRLSDIPLNLPSDAAPHRVHSKSKINVISNQILPISRQIYRVRNLFRRISDRFLSRRLLRNDLLGDMHLAPLVQILRVITIIILYLAITLIYSTNPAYGAEKILNIIISDIPNIIVFFYLMTYQQKEPYAKQLIFIIAIGFIITLIGVLTFQPFNHSTIYQFEPQRWSHVFIGRMISFLTLIVFIYLLNQKESKKIIIYALVFTIGLYITYLTGLRSALIGLALCTLLSITWNIYKKNMHSTHIYTVIMILVITSLLVYLTPQGFSTSQRLSSLVKIEDLDFGNDAAILSRVESYKLSWQMFTENPIIGNGFGSFNGYNNIEWTTIQKYPHNIILEILSELGLLGTLIFGIIFYQIVRSIYNLEFIIYNSKSSIHHPASSIQYPPSRATCHPELSVIPSEVEGRGTRDEGHHPSPVTHFLLLTFFFSLFLAMFSKDISTQSFLWLFLAVVSDQRIGK